MLIMEQKTNKMKRPKDYKQHFTAQVVKKNKRFFQIYFEVSEKTYIFVPKINKRLQHHG